MHKLKLFCIAFVLFLSLTGCYADRGQLENSNPHAEGQQQDEQDRIIPSYKTIYEAIENKELEKAIVLLQEALKSNEEIDLTQRDDQGRSLLHFAIVNANPSQEALYVEIVRLLIKLKQDVNARDNEKNKLLHVAAFKGLFLVVEKLVKNGANIHAEDNWGEIPLHWAVEGGNIEVVRLLIDQSKIVEKNMISLILTEPDNYIDKKDNYGRTPLYSVMDRLRRCVSNPELGNPEDYILIIKFLVALGADVHTEDKQGITLLHIAAQTGCVEIVRMLLEEKVEVNSCNENGNSSLELAVCCSSDLTKAKDCLTIVNMLIEAGADVHHKNKYNNNLLHNAVIHRNTEMIKLLIEHKVEIDSENCIRQTPFHLAVANSADIESNILEQQGYLDVLNLLINRGAEIDAVDSMDDTPLQVAVKKGADKLAIYLLKQEANCRGLLLHYAIKSIKRCYPNRKDAYIAIIKHLISLEMDIDINDVDDNGNTPLHLVIKRLWIPGFSKVVNLLIAAGADIHAVNNKGNTPLYYMRSYIREVLL